MIAILKLKSNYEVSDPHILLNQVATKDILNINIVITRHLWYAGDHAYLMREG